MVRRREYVVTMQSKPKHPFCWSCSRKLQGRHHAKVKTHGGEVVVHIECGERMEKSGEGWEVVK